MLKQAAGLRELDQRHPLLAGTGTCKRKVSKVAGQTLDCYCVCCELLSASIADVLWFVNIVCLPLITEQNAHEICLTLECFQIVRRLLWKQTTTLSLRNINPMFHSNLWSSSFTRPSTQIVISSFLAVGGNVITFSARRLEEKHELNKS